MLSRLIVSAPIRRIIVSGAAYSSYSRVVCEDLQPPKITLYQYAICPFCNIVKSYLDYQQLAYDVVEVNPVTKSELKFSEQYKKVPVIVIDGNQINESAVILHELTKSFPLKDKTNVSDQEESDKWLEWSEKKLAVLLYPNITRSMKESWECFRYVICMYVYSILYEFI